MAVQIDSHHHLWRYNPAEFDWLEGPLEPLRRDFLVPQLQSVLCAAGVDFSIAVQARQSLQETDWLLELAAATPQIAGVVGWAPIADPGFSAMLPRLLEHRHLKGLRHVVQGEADPEFLLGKDFNAGITALRGTGLVYDLLILERQLPMATRFVDLHPEQAFVLDHIAKPKIAAGVIEPWAANLRELAQRPNVSCKLSGLVTEADPTDWTLPQLEPYLDVTLEAFGPDRVMAGSDWPVCLAGTSYSDWFNLLRSYCRSFTSSEQDAIFGGTAAAVYLKR